MQPMLPVGLPQQNLLATFVILLPTSSQAFVFFLLFFYTARIRCNHKNVTFGKHVKQGKNKMSPITNFMGCMIFFRASERLHMIVHVGFVWSLLFLRGFCLMKRVKKNFIILSLHGCQSGDDMDNVLWMDQEGGKWWACSAYNLIWLGRIKQ